VPDSIKQVKLTSVKRYHSIYARGEKVEDVLKDFDEQESNEVFVVIFRPSRVSLIIHKGANRNRE
jgi:hypothetical protein